MNFIIRLCIKTSFLLTSTSSFAQYLDTEKICTAFNSSNEKLEQKLIASSSNKDCSYKVYCHRSKALKVSIYFYCGKDFVSSFGKDGSSHMTISSIWINNFEMLYTTLNDNENYVILLRPKTKEHLVKYSVKNKIYKIEEKKDSLSLNLFEKTECAKESRKFKGSDTCFKKIQSSRLK